MPGGRRTPTLWPEFWPEGAVMEVGIAKAKDTFSELVERAEAGEVVTITRHGRPVATLNPARRRPTREEAEAVFSELSAYRDQMPRLTDDELVEIIREGRRY